jgi:hypothetical protein
MSSPKSQFSYHSEQVHSVFTGGKGETRRNIVNIQNGKGTKAVETFDASGQRKSRKEKKLTSKELDCIRRNKFIPGLFSDCVKPLGSSLRPNKTIRRRRN